MHFSNIIKPTHNCNFSCNYCYIEDDAQKIMSEETLVNVIKKTFDYCKKKQKSAESTIDFIWHGGEPLIPGISFYQKVVEIQNACCEKKQFQNSIQTNGTLINDDWVSFFTENKFNVSVSIDGVKSVNDQNRLYKNGKGTFDDVMTGIKKVRRAGLNLGTCFVVSKQSESHIEEIYRFFVKEKLPFNIIPMTYSGNAKEHFSEIALNNSSYSKVWTYLFDQWFYANDENYIYCSDFAVKASSILAGEATDCGFWRFLGTPRAVFGDSGFWGRPAYL